MSASPVNAPRKVTDSGKWRMVSLFVTPGAEDTNPEVAASKVRLRKSIRNDFRIDLS
jgi:hypothetical protein